MIADSIRTELVDAETDVVVHQDLTAHIVVSTAHCTFTIVHRPRGLYLVPMYGEYGKYIKTDSYYVHGRKCPTYTPEAITEEVVKFTRDLSEFMTTLRARMRESQRRSDTRIAVCTAILKANPSLESNNYGVDLFGSGIDWQMSAEILDSGVSMYISCTNEQAVKIAKILGDEP